MSIHFESWKALFLIFGLTTSMFGILMFFFLADSPITAKWLSDEERHLAVERLRGNQQGLGSRVFKWYQVKETFTDIRVSASLRVKGIDREANIFPLDLSYSLLHGMSQSMTKEWIPQLIPLLGKSKYTERRYNGFLHSAHSRIWIYFRGNLASFHAWWHCSARFQRRHSIHGISTKSAIFERLFWHSMWSIRYCFDGRSCNG
jgi:hypothetical protein